MPKKRTYAEVPVEKIRWRLDPASLPFRTTDDLEPLKDIVGQNRGVEAFKFGIGISKRGYNVFVTGMAGTGRLSTAIKLLEEVSSKGQAPDDLCYVNNFKDPEFPILFHFKPGNGSTFKKDIAQLVANLKKEIPQLLQGP